MKKIILILVLLFMITACSENLESDNDNKSSIFNNKEIQYENVSVNELENNVDLVKEKIWMY